MRLFKSSAHHTIDIIIFIHSNGLMIVKSLSFKDFSKLSLVTGGFLYLGSLVLEPDFDLIILKTKFSCKISPSLFGEIAVGIEFVLEPLKLFAGEGCSWSLISCGLR